MAKKIRSKMLTFAVTESEKELLLKVMANNDKSASEYMRDAVFKQVMKDLK